LEIFNKALSKGEHIILVIIGEDGAPCGNIPLKHAICAITVAASIPSE